MRLAMMIELEKCVGCKACVSACKEQWDSGPGAARPWVHSYESGQRGGQMSVTFYPGLCMQCEEHPCTRDCPTGATYMDEQGVVVVDPDVCIGCGNCISNCPYEARHYDPVKKIVEKCNLCEPYVARGEQPACVRTCLAECRHLVDLDDVTSPLTRMVRDGEAKPLVTAEVNERPKVTFVGDAQREEILRQRVVRAPKRSLLTEIWTGASLPLTKYAVPLLGASAIGGGIFASFLSRKQRLQEAARAEKAARAAKAAAAKADSQAAAATEPQPETAAAPAPACAEPKAQPAQPKTLPRHSAGMRFIHWFNAISWVLLLSTGIGLMSAKSFAFFGQGFPAWMSNLFGSDAHLIRFHAVWGVVWAAVIVPLFLLYKRGGREALEEVRLRKGDYQWLMLKPLAMFGLTSKPLPPQDKYNAGQKMFAMLAVLGTAGIIATGVVMTFHLGSAATVSAAILVHKLAIAVMLLGVSLHLAMAVFMSEERPALWSMFTGRVDRHHAEQHNALWVEELDEAERATGPAGQEK